MEIIVVLGIIIVVLIVVIIKLAFDTRKLNKMLDDKNKWIIENVQRLQNSQNEKEKATKLAKEAEDKLFLLSKHFENLGIHCVSGPYPIFWNDFDVTFLTKNAFVKKGCIYPDPDNGKEQKGSLVVVVNKATKEYLFLDFMTDIPKK